MLHLYQSHSGVSASDLRQREQMVAEWADRHGYPGTEPGSLRFRENGRNFACRPAQGSGRFHHFRTVLSDASRAAAGRRFASCPRSACRPSPNPSRRRCVARENPINRFVRSAAVMSFLVSQGSDRCLSMRFGSVTDAAIAPPTLRRNTCSASAPQSTNFN